MKPRYQCSMSLSTYSWLKPSQGRFRWPSIRRSRLLSRVCLTLPRIYPFSKPPNKLQPAQPDMSSSRSTSMKSSSISSSSLSQSTSSSSGHSHRHSKAPKVVKQHVSFAYNNIDILQGCLQKIFPGGFRIAGVSDHFVDAIVYHGLTLSRPLVGTTNWSFRDSFLPYGDRLQDHNIADNRH